MPPKKATTVPKKAPLPNGNLSLLFKAQVARQAQPPPPPAARPRSSPPPPSSSRSTPTPPPPADSDEDTEEEMDWMPAQPETSKDGERGKEKLDEIMEAAPPQAPATSGVSLAVAVPSTRSQDMSTRTGLAPLTPIPVASTSNKPASAGIVSTIEKSSVPLKFKVTGEKLVWLDEPKAIVESEIYFQDKKGIIHYNYPADKVEVQERVNWRYKHCPELQDPNTSICISCWKSKTCIFEIKLSVPKSILKKVQQRCAYHLGNIKASDGLKAKKVKAKREKEREDEEIDEGPSHGGRKRAKTESQKSKLVPNGTPAFYAVLEAMNKASSKGYMTAKKATYARKALANSA